MNITIMPDKLRGHIEVIPSKSQAHRYLICAALSASPTEIICPAVNEDMEATCNCLRALNAQIESTPKGYLVTPITQLPKEATLNCGESGSTLRFLLPVVGALGVNATFCLSGRLPQRPLSPLWEEMERMGCTLSRPTADTIYCTGQLQSGQYTIPGNISSQYISGLLLCFPLLKEGGNLQITSPLESSPYVSMTQRAMERFGVNSDNYQVAGNQKYHSPGKILVEGDWSNGAFFLAANELGSEIELFNLDIQSPQGDKEITQLLPLLREDYVTIDATQIPDLVPILSVVAACKHGACFTGIQRLRLKESDRVASTIKMIENLGGKASANEHSMQIQGTGLIGGTVNSYRDHRIAMAAAVAATACRETVTILGADCVAKSYPGFWKDYHQAGGKL